jgi:hypothetical protein
MAAWPFRDADGKLCQLIDAFVITYRGTDVVAFNRVAHAVSNDGTRHDTILNVVFNTGGWYTMTTKLRMNQASNEYDLGVGVRQRDFDWYIVDDNGNEYPFTADAMHVVMDEPTRTVLRVDPVTQVW